MKKMIQGALKLLLLLVFLGILFVWIMTPTTIHREHWQAQIRAKTDSPSFGHQGGFLLEYTFPMLFVAVFGCVYLHLVPKTDQSKKSGVSALVKGPLGIVSWTELFFVVMFALLLIWSLGAYVKTAFSQITPQSAQEEGMKVWQARLVSAGLRLGLVGNICLSFLFFPVTRGSSVLRLVGLTSESSIKYHIWLGHTVMILFTSHGLCYIACWISNKDLSPMLHWNKTGVSIVAGEISLLAGLAMWATTFARIRRTMFELFFYTHYLYVIFVVFFIFHTGTVYYSIMLPGLYLFFIDRYLRFLQSRTNVRLVSSRVLPCQTVELNFAKTTGLEYSPTSILFVNVPSISKLQWHPFTVTSNSSLEPEVLSVVIKREGSWTTKLCQILSAPSSVDRLDVAVEGPYGPGSTNYLRYDTLVLISGGSGITPFFSIIRELIFMSSTMHIKTPRIHLVSVFKFSEDLAMLDLILPISGTPSDISGVQLQIEAYVTRDRQPTTSTNKTIWFKPNASYLPVSPILGHNNWLWLGAIISCSFIIFLILLAIITRYHIYPIDHNANKMYPSAVKAVIHMLLICLSIVAVSSVVVFKNKNQNAVEAKQIPMTASPGSRHLNSDRELESVPRQSLVQATNVHYGERPDLKRILSECQGSSIGVFASGPKPLRHDVATICSSELTGNVHFESISFSW